MDSTHEPTAARRGRRNRNRTIRRTAVAAAAFAALVGSGFTTAEAQFPFKFRTIDGRGNNTRRPGWGQAGTTLLRRTTVSYADGRATPAGSNRPSARVISNTINAQPQSVTNARPVSDFVWQWGQFLDHDIDLTEPATPAESFPIPVPMGDPYFDPFRTGTQVIPLDRSIYKNQRVRQQVNEITAFIDASNIYGSDKKRERHLRGRGGTMRMTQDGLLENNTIGLPNAPDPRDTTMFLSGDVRVNENVGLITLHTLFSREHNRIVKMLKPWVRSSERRYQIARAIVGAEIQAITYNEFLPALLGRGALSRYRGYDRSVNPGIANFFSTAAYRFGHSMLSPQLLRLDRNLRPIRAGHLPLKDAFFNPDEIRKHGIEPVLRGLCAQRPQEIDPMLVDDVRNFLFGPPGAGGFDLASLNIQRGRDHGLPSYNQARRDYGLRPARTFADVSSDPTTQRKLRALYGSVEEIDAWVGGLAEDHVRGALVGELVYTALKDQFERLRDGDRFWYERHLPRWIVWYVEQMTLGRIIRANTSIGRELPSDVFHVRP